MLIKLSGCGGEIRSQWEINLAKLQAFYWLQTQKESIEKVETRSDY